ncbi:unnamed protein product [marine sediment metagenome]|uniref:Radical SAM core domain-containing protein n=1 Tax=marine sediment metagenome TaxID=412755 RepID=X0SXK2_9ZZZZ
MAETKEPRRKASTKGPRRLSSGPLTGSGTREWADTNLNIQIGCEHNCRYCYARHRAVERFKYCKSLEDWRNPVINKRKIKAKYQKYFGTVMYPSTHDITPRNINESVGVVRKLLDAGNKVLIVSKPHLPCIERLCKALWPRKEKILFRFTIGSMNDEILRFWEPGAPRFVERINCLVYARRWGFGTSVSCEPYLDERVDLTYQAVLPWLTESFWVGMLRRFDSRVKLDDVSEIDMHRFVMVQRTIQTEQRVRALYDSLNGKEFVKWKDSVREVMRI